MTADLTLDLTDRQAAFVAAYTSAPTLGNATASAVAAGYSEHSAPGLLETAAVRKAISDVQAEATARTKISKWKAMAELGRIAFTDIRQIVVWRQITEQTGEVDSDGVPETRTRTELALTDWATMNPDAAAALAEISEGPNGLKVKMHSKTTALAELGRHLGIAQKFAHTGPDGTGPVETITREMTAEEAAEFYRRTLEEC